MVMRYPGARWDPLGPQTQRQMLSHDIITLHTMVGTLAGTSAMFHRDGYGGTESHLGIDDDNLMLQWQDLMFRADANHHGAHRCISIECQDKGPAFPTWSGENVPAFTRSQIDKLVHCLTWLTSREAHAGCPRTWACHKVGIPRVMIPDTLPGRRGISVHRQGVTSYPPGSFKMGWRVPNGELWSASSGKVCPGDRRINQTREVIVPRLQLTTTPPVLEDYDMPFEIHDGKRVRAVIGGSVIGYPSSAKRAELQKSFADKKVPFPTVTVSADWFDRISISTAASVALGTAIAEMLKEDRIIMLTAAGIHAAAGGDLDTRLDEILEVAELRLPVIPDPPVVEDGE